MVVDPKQPNHRDGGSKPSGTKTPLMISVAIHVVVILLVIIGLPHWKRDIQIIDPVPVQLVDNIGELASTNKPPVKAEPKKEEKKPEPKKEEKKEEKKPEPKKETIKPPPEEVLTPAPKKEEKKPEPKKVEKKPEPKKEPKKEEKKPDPKKEQQDFDSLLNDLTPDDPNKKSEENTPDKAEPAPAPNVSRFSDVISMTEMDALRYQLSQCWNIMAGAMDAQNLVVEVRVVVNPDRTVRSAKIVDQFRYSSDPVFRAAADQAIWALKKPQCSPLNLPPEKYDIWREMTIVFDPKEMF